MTPGQEIKGDNCRDFFFFFFFLDLLDRSLVRVCDSLCGKFCSCNFPELQRKLGLFALSIGEKHSVWRISLSM